MLWKRLGTVLLIAVFALCPGELGAEAVAVKKSEEAKWCFSYTKAVMAAEENDNLILAYFTGSDWCPWCAKLKTEVFDTEEFKEWAKKNVTLLYLDFPRHKSQSDVIKQQNEKLSKKYNVKGFPAVLLLTPDGEVVGNAGYREGGARQWIERFQSFIDSFPKPQVIEPKKSLVSALTYAKEKNLLLLLILTEQPSDFTNRKIKILFRNNDFATLVDWCITVVRLDLPLGADSNAEERKALDGIVERHQLKSGRLQLVLLDLKNDKVLYQCTSLSGNVKFLVRDLEKAIQLQYDGEWLDNFDRARAIANQKKLAMLLNFTGSDWCQFCAKLKTEVFDTREFKDYAKKNLVLVNVDFPKKKVLPADTKLRNEALSRKYNVKGFPTIIILDQSGEQMGRLGYMEGGPLVFLKQLKQFGKQPQIR